MYVAIAQFLVFQKGDDNLPYFHQHLWMTDGTEYAIVELVDYEKECMKTHPVTMHCFKWWLEERADIGV